MLQVVGLLALGIWTLAFVRVLAARATVTLRIAGAYVAVGAFAGALGVTIVAASVAPYGYRGGDVVAFLSSFVSNVLTQAILLVPVLMLLLQRDRFKLLSVADAFLLAFCAGFGCDFAVTLLAASDSSAVLPALSIVPPFVANTASGTIAGYAYWTAAEALVAIMLLRFFSLSVRNTLVSTGAVLLFFAFVRTLPGALSLVASATPWLVLAFAAFLQVWEQRWVRARVAQPVAEGALLDDVRKFWPSSSRAAIRSNLAHASGEEYAGAPSLEPKLLPGHWIPWVCIVFVFVMLPQLGPLNAWFWLLPLFTAPSGGQSFYAPTAVLLIFVALRYLTFVYPRTSVASVDDAIVLPARLLNVHTALGVVLLVIFFTLDGRIRALAGSFAVGHDIGQLPFTLLILAMAIAVTQSDTSARTIQSRNATMFGVSCLVAFIGSSLFDWLQATMHANLAPMLFNAGLGYNTQSFIDVVSMIVTFGVTFGIGVAASRVFRAGLNRIDA